ncbi:MULTISPECIES: hypothetical protein [Aeromonas]|uniref:Uncharacterized protein n=1 Tax=Aeromonas caviae TaxID=648 RepID=A0A6S4T2L2_AERCA|nr:MULTISPECIES: hypothetical protein [Aeromonas]MDO2950135.1 hypothetical protein [Aeromonas simiae]MDO2953462.1 hypothetical protein [Aeromonas simiae]MDO2957543.1 hypothetical protein [Aeromonas simiae]BBQ29450.1 hypothetical protein WP2W18E01_10320 [Aeromonas caviae]
MHDLRDYKTLSARQLTAAIGQLNHNTAPKIMTHLALRARQQHPLGNGRSRAKALTLLRRVKKAHQAGRILFELTVTGCRIDRGSHQADRYYYDRTLLAQGWQQYDTEEDAWYFGIWIHTEKLETFTYAEGDTNHVIAPNVEAFRTELARLYQFHPQAPAFICINREVGIVTHYL